MSATPRPAGPRRTRIKVCCIASPEEAALATELGADAVGLVGAMPSGPGVITDGQVAAIAAGLAPAVSGFLLTAETTAESIARHVERTGVSTVQLVAHIDPAESAALARRLPRVRRVQVLHVEGRQVLEHLEAYRPHVHGFLLDSGRPGAAVPELGGTGRVHDWAISRAFVEACGLPVFLAGGLTPANVGEAIRVVRPYGVDICTGVRENGQLSRARLADFVSAVRRADQDG
jgi:phosphoribosylanthranilate isomerase